MRTLVYFASGPYNKSYQELPFDRIFLVDNMFRGYQLLELEKVILVGMDCLKSIEYFKTQGITIDYFVSLNEGLGEGGGSYAINSDMFLGYVMPLLNDEYYHMMYPGYYGKYWNVKMDLPYHKEAISRDENSFFDPMLFSTYAYNKDAEVYKMTKKRTELPILSSLHTRISIIHDSIWCDYDALDMLFLSLKQQGQGDFFEHIPKVKAIERYTPITDILNFCNDHKLSSIGITPWMNGKYQNLIPTLKSWNKPYPSKINLYHLNRGDYGCLRGN
jgi:hypothetical protein